VQCCEKPCQLATGTIPVDQVDDLEQRRTGHSPGNQEQRVGTADNNLGQERNPGLARQGRQYAAVTRLWRTNWTPRGRMTGPPNVDFARTPMAAVLRQGTSSRCADGQEVTDATGDPEAAVQSVHRRAATSSPRGEAIAVRRFRPLLQPRSEGAP